MTIADSAISDNAAIANGANNRITNNALRANANGVLIGNPGNFALANTVSGSANTGISIETIGAPSTVRSNTVLGSGVVDMSDGSAQCDGNIWRANIFDTALVNNVSDGGPKKGCI